MAIEYLKKKKMHSIMCDIFGIAPKMIDTHYNFHRGSEWLQCSYGGCCYEIYASNGGAYLTSESKEYDWDADRYVNVNRKVYNGYGKYTYPIHEKCLAEEQETFDIEDLPFPDVADKSPEEFIEIPEENVLPFPGPEIENELLSPDDAREYVEYKYNEYLSDCSKPYGCDEEHLNYLHGYFTMAGELGAVTMHRAEDMVHELTHEYDKAKESEVKNQENKPWEMMDAEERADEFFNFSGEPEQPEGTCSLLTHLLETGQDPEKYLMLENAIMENNAVLLVYTKMRYQMIQGFNGTVTDASIQEIKDWVDSRDTWLN